MLIASAFGVQVIMTWSWQPILGVLFFGWPVQWLIRRVAKRDPQWTTVYFRARKLPLVREPHGYRDAKPAKAPVIIPKPSTWLR